MAGGQSKKIGKYDVLDVLGRGGMGIVYKAVDPGIGRTVAIKMTTGAMGEVPEMLERFNREAQSVGKLQHPNIVTVYDLGVEDGHPYMVMELLDGESLDSLLHSRRSLSIEEKLDIVVQICNGVQYAHQRNVTHRDIKPANIMILKDGTAKIVDFGIARTGVQMLTRPGQLVGSFQYMSPEQINATNVDSRTDIFSIGVLLFQLMVGKLPFEGKDTGEMLMKVLHDSPPSLTGLVKNCPPGLDDIVQRALAKDPERRYQTAEDLALDLGHVLEKCRRERISEYLQGAETAAAQRQWARAKEQLLQVLKRDRQNSRANARMREVQLEMQKLQRSERAKELQAQAEHAMAQSDLAAALTCLNEAVELDPGNLEIVQLRDSIRENRSRDDKLQELMQRAELAQDAGDLEEARKAVEEGLAIDPQNTDFRSMQVVITRELISRDTQKRVQEFLGEARKQISSRRFTAALEVLRKAEGLDPSGGTVQELIILATKGQQQERQRLELEQLATQIEEALVKEDYATASARIEAGLSSYPEDRGLLKLKAVVDKQREGIEKRRYIEQQTTQVRVLLEGGQAAEALVLLQSALEKYPAEPSLDSMVALVQQSIARTRNEQEKTEVIQRAREAIRRKEYSAAISILEAARKRTTSSEFDELLQFAQNEAEDRARRQKIDAVAEEAHRLTSEDKYPEAMALLKATLQEVQDQELQIILDDIVRHIEEFNAGVEKALATADRLVRQDRYTDAIKVLEGQNTQYGKAPKFRESLESLRKKQQLVHAIALFKEAVRDALAKGDISGAKLLCQNFRKSNGIDETALTEIALAEKGIEVKQAEAANQRLEVALGDARVLLTVRSYSVALSVLESVASVAPLAAPELQQKFDSLQIAAKNALARQTKLNAPPEATPASVAPTAINIENETQPADPDRLQSMLVQVSRMAGNYRQDSKLQTEIYNLQQRMTKQISLLRESSDHRRAAVVERPDASGKLTRPAAPPASPESRVASLPAAREPAAPAAKTPKTATQFTQIPTTPQPPGSVREKAFDAAEASRAKSVSTSTEDNKREEAVRECLERVRALRADGDLAGASSSIKEQLVNYPRETRLTQTLETLLREIESQKRQARSNDLHELQRIEEQAGLHTETGILDALSARARALAGKYPEDEEILSASDRVLERIKATFQKPTEKEKKEAASSAEPMGPSSPATAAEPPRPELRTPSPAASVQSSTPPLPPRPAPVTSRPAVNRQPAPPSDPTVNRRPAVHPDSLADRAGSRRAQIALVGAAVVLILAIGGYFRANRSKRFSKNENKPLLVATLEVHTSPPGATIRVNDEVRGTSDLKLDLPPGTYQIQTELNGYKPEKVSVDAKSGSPNSVNLTLQPELPMVRLSSDTGTGSVTLDDRPAVDLGGQPAALSDIPAGDHKLTFEGPQGSASFAFSTNKDSAPAVTGPIAARRIVAVVVANQGPLVHVYSSDPTAEVSLDGQPSAQLSLKGLELQNVSAGAHELLVKNAGNQFKLAIDVGESPTLTTFLQSGKVGTLIVMTHEDGVTVLVNGNPQKTLTRGGQLRIPNLDPKQYMVSVAKAGFQDGGSQKVTLRAGDQSTLIFSMVPIPRVASLSIRGAPVGAQVFIDDKLVGTIQTDGTLSQTNINPGDHVIMLRKERFETKRLQKRFVAGSETAISGTEASLQSSTGELRITFSPPDALVMLVKGTEILAKVTNGETLNLPPGVYMLTARTSDNMVRTKVEEVVAGQSTSVNLSLSPDGMSKWDDPSGWKAENNTYVRKGGGFVLFGVTPTTGTFSFSVMLQKGKRLQWVLNYTGPTNYVLFQMDENYFYRSTFRNNEPTDEVKIPHKMQKKDFQTMRIRVSPNEIVHQIQNGANWLVLDRWSSPGTNLALGKFGFNVPGKDQIAVVNFTHYPDLDTR
jgi:eukaryotic-like serine/threonine-protein kinase